MDGPTRTPACPLCGWPPLWLLGGGTQAFCGNDDCTCLTWNPSKSLDANLLDAGVVRLEPPSFTCPRCGMTSPNPNDIREGYCGACHDWTGAP